jgi:probable phosphoglycerate mutase
MSMPGPLIYYARHGQTEWNVEGRLQGQRDSRLTPAGQAQAARCGEILRDLLGREARAASTFDYVASPLGRARDSMERLRVKLGLPPDGYRTDARLAELAFGQWEGLAFSQLQVTDPDAIAARERDKWNFVPPGGESYADLAARVATWRDSVTRDSIVVAHGGTARALFALSGAANTDAAPLLDVDQGVVYRLAPGPLARFA